MPTVIGKISHGYFFLMDWGNLKHIWEKIKGAIELEFNRSQVLITKDASSVIYGRIILGLSVKIT